jgi:hypothetical protein
VPASAENALLAHLQLDRGVVANRVTHSVSGLPASRTFAGCARSMASRRVGSGDPTRLRRGVVGSEGVVGAGRWSRPAPHAAGSA